MIRKIGINKVINAFLMVASASVNAQESITYSVKTLSACPSIAQANNTFTLFDGRTNLLKGWNHADTRPEYQYLSRPTKTYNVDDNNLKPLAECGGENVFTAVLIKKLGTWERNHSSGIEPNIERANIRFGDVEFVVLEFKINSQQSVLPTVEVFNSTFAFAATPEQLKQTDAQQFNFGITLFEPGFNDQSTASLNAQTRITLDPNTHADQWLQVELPLAKMHVYLEQNYVPTDVPLADHDDRIIAGLRINPETQSGKVVRHLNGKPWEAGEQVELFKEQSITLRRVALRYKSNPEAVSTRQ